MHMQPRLVGSLVTAMLEFSAKTTGAPVSHIELSNGTRVLQFSARRAALYGCSYLLHEA